MYIATYLLRWAITLFVVGWVIFTRFHNSTTTINGTLEYVIVISLIHVYGFMVVVGISAFLPAQFLGLFSKEGRATGKKLLSKINQLFE